MRGLNRDDIIRMAIDAIGGDMNGQDAQHLAWRLEHFKDDSYEFGPDALLKFVSLIAAAERERIRWDAIHSCHSECDKPVCVAIRKAVAEEREACAKLCEQPIDEIQITDDCSEYKYRDNQECADAIRARGDALAKLNQAAEDNGEPL